MSALLRLALVLACAGVAGAAAAPPTAIPPEVPARTGRVEDDLKDSLGKQVIHYVLEAPARLHDSRTMGLLVCFHGNGQQAAQHADIWKDVLKAGRLEQDYVVLSLKSQGAYWTEADNANVLRAIDWATDTYPIDLRRVHAYGFSAGAHYVGTFGLTQQQRFASLSCYAYAPGGAPPPLGGRELAPHVWLVIGTEDGFLDRKDLGTNFRNVLSGLGYRYVFREIKGGGHDLGPGTTVTVDNLRWMHALRSKHVPLAKDQEEFFRQAKAVKKAEELWADAAGALKLIGIGGHYAEAAALKVVKGKHEAARLAAVASGASVLYGAEMLAQLGRALVDPAPALREQAIAALADAASWNHAEARTLLVAFAADRKHAVADRERAIQALAQAARMIGLAENYDDTIVVPGLVGLLDDPEATVRERAFAALKAINSDAFGYDPAAAERGAAIERWRAWATAKCSFYKVPAPTKRK